MTSSDDGLIDVVMLGLPVEVYRRVSEHYDELQREFALLRAGSAADANVPHRLLTLIEELNSRYQGFTANTRQELLDAMDRREKTIDLVYRVPADIRAATIHLADLLDEADEFCRAGEDLLTLAAPPEAVAYRRWLLSQFVRQIDGEPPTPWSDFRP